MYTGPDTIIASKDNLGVRKGGKPPCNAEDNLRAGLLVIEARLLRESWTKGSSGVRPVVHWAGLMGCEDTKAEDYTRVLIGLSLAWKAS